MPKLTRTVDKWEKYTEATGAEEIFSHSRVDEILEILNKADEEGRTSVEIELTPEEEQAVLEYDYRR
jgi:hypothetical protein